MSRYGRSGHGGGASGSASDALTRALGPGVVVGGIVEVECHPHPLEPAAHYGRDTAVCDMCEDRRQGVAMCCLPCNFDICGSCLMMERGHTVVATKHTLPRGRSLGAGTPLCFASSLLRLSSHFRISESHLLWPLSVMPVLLNSFAHTHTDEKP